MRDKIHESSDDDEPQTATNQKGKKRSATGIVKSKHQIQNYRPKWEKLAECKYWLKPAKSSVYKAYCVWCDTSMTAELTVIKKHAAGMKHQEHQRDIRPEVQQPITKFATPVINDGVHRAEMIMSGFLAAHNISFLVMDHLAAVQVRAFPDSKITQGLQLKRTKATSIVKFVIGKTQKEILINTLKVTKFSIMVDESTDIAACKTMCIVVRFYDVIAERVVSQFWDLVQVFGEEEDLTLDHVITADAARLFELIVESFDNCEIPRENVIGFGSDGCNTMMGCNNSVATRLREMFPGITIMRCLCHSLSLCANGACTKLPRSPEDLARNIYNYFSSSNKRMRKLQQFQAFCDADIHKMLQPAQTRWLSLTAVVDRIIEQWDALRLFFDSEYLVENTKSVESIHVSLHDPFIKGYFIFLQWALPKFTNLNRFFQSESAIVVNVHERMALAFTDLLRSYMDNQYVARTPLHQVNPALVDYYIPIENVYLGIGVTKQLQLEKVKSHPNLITDLKKKCRDFLVEGCVQLQKRYNFDDKVMESISMLLPKTGLSVTARDRYPSIMSLVDALPRISPSDPVKLQQLDDEWRQIVLIDVPDEIKNETEADIFWSKVAKHCDSSGDPYLTILPQFALDALCIPHANAQCERVFSKVNLIKTKSRNRLITSTVTGALLSSEYIKKYGACCDTFEPSPQMLSLMTSANLYPEKERKSDAEKNSKESYNEDPDLDDFVLLNLD